MTDADLDRLGRTLLANGPDGPSNSAAGERDCPSVFVYNASQFSSKQLLDVGHVQKQTVVRILDRDAH
jgi:hypothetical protein